MPASTLALLPPAKNALSAPICFASLANSASIACAFAAARAAPARETAQPTRAGMENRPG
ncbi:MAG: hypothetical protein LBG79_06920 [Spirochaetaceae bacterium]|nr:hypothetical protein [Spirochaetaceae bacterium]